MVSNNQLISIFNSLFEWRLIFFYRVCGTFFFAGQVVRLKCLCASSDPKGERVAKQKNFVIRYSLFDIRYLSAVIVAGSLLAHNFVSQFGYLFSVRDV